MRIFWTLLTLMGISAAAVAAPPQYCVKRQEALMRLDRPSKMYWSTISNNYEGYKECLTEVSNLPLEELKAELKAATDSELAICGRPYNDLLPRERSFECEIAHDYTLNFVFDLRERNEEPNCHEYYRQRDTLKYLTKEHLAKLSYSCEQERSIKP